MALASRLTVAGISAVQAAAIQGTVESAATATGSTSQTGSYPLKADITYFTTGGAGTGALLPSMNSGDSMTVFNGTATAILLYPPVGAALNKLSANASYSIAAATPYVDIYCVTPTLYICSQSA
jgi:hypothetical protein